MSHLRSAALVFTFALLAAAVSAAEPASSPDPVPVSASGSVSAESMSCVSCHQVKTPGIVAQWRASRHAAQGIGLLRMPRRGRRRTRGPLRTRGRRSSRP